MANIETALIAVLHIPHSSRQVPVEEARRAILLDDAALNSELDLRWHRPFRRTSD